MVTARRRSPSTRTRRARAGGSPPPSPTPRCPVLTIEDLGVLRDVAVDGDRVDRRRSPRPTRAAPRWTRSATTSCSRSRPPATATSRCGSRSSPAWTTDWMTDAGKRKLREYGIAPPTGRAAAPGPIRAAARREVPALRLARHPRGRPLRLDLVQGALRVPRVPRAVRPLQGALMAAQHLTEPRDERIADACSRAPSADRRLAAPRALPRPRVAAVRPLTDAAVEVTFAVPPRAARRVRLPRRAARRPARRRSTATRCGARTRSAGVDRRRRRAAISVAIKRDLGGRFSTWAPSELAPGDELDVMSPQGTFTSTSPTSTARTSPASPRARASRRSWRSPRTVLARVRDLAVHARLHEPLDDRRDVPRGARRPQGPLPGAARAAPRALARAARGAAAVGPHRRGAAAPRSSTRSCCPTPSTSGSSAGRSSSSQLCRDTLDDIGVAPRARPLRAVHDGRAAAAIEAPSGRPVAGAAADEPVRRIEFTLDGLSSTRRESRSPRTSRSSTPRCACGPTCRSPARAACAAPAARAWSRAPSR